MSGTEGKACAKGKGARGQAKLCTRIHPQTDRKKPRQTTYPRPEVVANLMTYTFNQDAEQIRASFLVGCTDNGSIFGIYSLKHYGLRFRVQILLNVEAWPRECSVGTQQSGPVAAGVASTQRKPIFKQCTCNDDPLNSGAGHLTRNPSITCLEFALVHLQRRAANKNTQQHPSSVYMRAQQTKERNSVHHPCTCVNNILELASRNITRGLMLGLKTPISLQFCSSQFRLNPSGFTAVDRNQIDKATKRRYISKKMPCNFGPRVLGHKSKSNGSIFAASQKVQLIPNFTG